MRSKVFNSFLFVLIASATAAAQVKLSGVVISGDGNGVRDVVVYLDNEKNATFTDVNGHFAFMDVSDGEHTLHLTSAAFRYQNVHVSVSGKDVFQKLTLQPLEETLTEVVISDVASPLGNTRMRPVEDFGIYEGKKSEVIELDQLVVNAATNNARQVYARVPGLNIWENDGAGLQLSIGGRGLDPNRTSNFNVRQNGYDISADALGYPESYYTPPVEGLQEIQVVRGAASLQYGTQFGGLVNFIMKKPVRDKKLELIARQSVGSFGFYSAFTSAGGTLKKLSYYSFFQYKTGNGWRDNSDFDNHTFYAHVDYSLSADTRVGLDFTQMAYLAQQPGGLTESMFAYNPRQTNRERNWFKVNWNLAALHLDHKFNAHHEVNVRAFGLSASRYAVGFRPNRVATVDDNSERDLLKGEFQNWGIESRLLSRYNIGTVQSVSLTGARYYHGLNHSVQGVGSASKTADFNFVNPGELVNNDYQFPNENVSLFFENVFYLNDRFSITPGVRFEHIKTIADGYYATFFKDLAGNVISIERTDEYRRSGRNFAIAGLGISYKPRKTTDVYSNVSQNYRSITFNDMRTANPSAVIDPNLQDEKGYSFDLGVRSEQTQFFNYDVSFFYLNYDNRIGEVQSYDENDRDIRRRGNIGQAIIQGVEAYGEADLIKIAKGSESSWGGIIFTNIALINSRYKASEIAGVIGKEVEFLPKMNLKSGLRIGYKNLKASLQATYLSTQFTDATNASSNDVSAVFGIIPAYTVMDFSLSYSLKNWRFEGNINNVTDRMYYTRRATGYPGPGILPSDGRSFYLTLQYKL